jgi:tetratricopeptide (TPR) repeat protein
MRIAHGALFFAFALVLGGWSFFDPFHEHVEKGNKKAREQKPDEALGRYDAAAKEAPSSPIPDYNRALVLAREGRVAEAKQAFESAQAAPDSSIAADAHYNFGNLLLDQNDSKGAIEQYLRSLDLDPADPDARRNLEIAMRRMEEQQQQQQQQNQQNEDSKEKDEQKDSPNQDQDSSESEKKDEPSSDPQKNPQQEEQPKEPQENAPDSSSSPGEEPPQPSSSAPLEGRLSREDAARLLNAIQSDELRVLRKLEDKKGQASEVANDW